MYTCWAGAVVRYGWIVSAPTYHKLPYRHPSPHHTIPSHPKKRQNSPTPKIQFVHSCKQLPINNAIACNKVLKQQLGCPKNLAALLEQFP